MKLHPAILSIALLTTSFCAADCHSIDDEQMIEISHFYGKPPANKPYRKIKTVEENSSVITLDDDSVWIVAGNKSQYVVRNWRPKENIVIYPTLFPYISGANFYFYHEASHTAAYVNIKQGGSSGQSRTLEIYEVDLLGKELVTITGKGNKTTFKINPDDVSKMQSWKRGEGIILGFYEDCYAGWFSSDPYILYDIERKAFVRASL